MAQQVALTSGAVGGTTTLKTCAGASDPGMVPSFRYCNYKTRYSTVGAERQDIWPLASAGFSACAQTRKHRSKRSVPRESTVVSLRGAIRKGFTPLTVVTVGTSGRGFRLRLEWKSCPLFSKRSLGRAERGLDLGDLLHVDLKTCAGLSLLNTAGSALATLPEPHSPWEFERRVWADPWPSSRWESFQEGGG